MYVHRYGIGTGYVYVCTARNIYVSYIPICINVPDFYRAHMYIATYEGMYGQIFRYTFVFFTPEAYDL